MIYCLISAFLMGTVPVFQQIIMSNVLTAKSVVFFTNFFLFTFFLFYFFWEKRNLKKILSFLLNIKFFLSMVFTSLGGVLLIYSIEILGAHVTALFGRLYIPYCLLLSSLFFSGESRKNYFASLVVVISTLIFLINFGENLKNFSFIVILPSLCFAISHLLLSCLKERCHKELLFFSALFSSIIFMNEGINGFSLIQKASLYDIIIFLFACVFSSSLGLFFYLKSVTEISISISSTFRSLTPIVTWLTNVSFSSSWGTTSEIVAYLLLLLPPLLKLVESKKGVLNVKNN